MSSTIALVMDRQFGAQVIELARRMPVWIVSSPTNDTAVEKARAMPGVRSSVTTIFHSSGEAAGEVLLRAICAIDEHHGPDSSSDPYDEIVVIGARADLPTQAMVKGLGFARISGFDNGFRLSKLSHGAKATQ